MSEVAHRLSLALIARDEARSITRCLESVRDVVDEMVVLDTGSTDDTPRLARAAGATVHAFTWVDDFAAARNAALDLCAGGWRLVLDADEWLAAGADALRALRHTEPTFVGLVDVESGTEGGEVTVSRQARVLPAGVRFEGRIHEQPVHDGRHRVLGVRLGHDGYLPDQLARKAGRNLRLLGMELAERPEDPYLHLQLGRAHEAEQRYAEAGAAYLTAYRLGDPTTSASPGWRHDLVVRLLHCLGRAGRTQEAVDVAGVELEHWEHSADFHFELGHVLLKHALAHPEAAGDLLPLVEQCWTRCLQLGDTVQLTGGVSGRGSHLAAQNLAMFYETQGRAAEARRIRGTSTQA